MFLPYIYVQHRLCGNIWTNTPEPDRMIGSSLSLAFLVMRDQVPRGCPFTESGTN
jgi:hypothetical protein